MPESRLFCFSWKLRQDDTESEESVNEDDEDDDDDEGYSRLQDHSDDQTQCASKGTGSARGDNGSDGTETNDRQCTDALRGENCGGDNKKKAYTKADKKARKLSRKLRRKEKKARMRHLLHVTWKWCKRGYQATVPVLGSMFNFAPNPSAAMQAVAVYNSRAGGKSVSVFV